jgi:hypothetical protein
MRQILTANATFNYGPGQPYLTAAAIWSMLQTGYDLAGFTVTLQAASGSYTEGEILTGALPGQVDAENVVILGNASNPANCTYQVPNTVAFAANEGAKYCLGGFNFYSGQANVAVDGAGSHVIINANTIFNTPQDYHLTATNGGLIHRVANYSIGSSAASHLNVFAGGNITVPVSGLVVTILGNSLWFTQGFVSNSGGYITDSAARYVQYNTWGPRYELSAGGSIWTGDGSASHFPGSQPGINNGGYYA